MRSRTPQQEDNQNTSLMNKRNRKNKGINNNDELQHAKRMILKMFKSYSTGTRFSWMLIATCCIGLFLGYHVLFSEDYGDYGTLSSTSSRRGLWKIKPDRSRVSMNNETLQEALARFRAKSIEKKFSIKAQVTDPYIYPKSDTRSFGCLRDECRGLAMEDLTNRKWKMLYKTAKQIVDSKSQFRERLNTKATIWESDTTELTKLHKERPEIYEAVYVEQQGKTYLNVLEGANAIGGNKGQQIRSKKILIRDAYANSGMEKQCTYNDMAIQPAQYRLYVKDECEEFLRNTGNTKSFLLKPETGSQGKGITFHPTVSSVKSKAENFFPCIQNTSIDATERMLVQEYIEHPLLLEKSKFDVRVYMLIASTEPWMVFYHRGYLRRSLFEYDPKSTNRAVYLTNTHYQSMRQNFKLSDHIWTFESLQNYLIAHGKTGPNYVDSILDPYLKRVANFIFQSGKRKLERRKGSFHIFGLDFMIDDSFRVHFIEANGYPGYTWSINFDTRSMVTEQFNLVTELHEHPTAFEKMRAGDRYENFEMIYSELEEAKSGKSYDPCYEFHSNEKDSKVLRSANTEFSKYTGFVSKKMLEEIYGASDPDCKTKACLMLTKRAKSEAARLRGNSERFFEGFNDDIEGIEYLGGSKLLQVSSLAQYFKSHKCSLNKVGPIPPSYRVFIRDECQNVLKYRTSSSWLLKPFDGSRAKGFSYAFDQQVLEVLLEKCSKSLNVNPKQLTLDNVHEYADHTDPEMQYVVQKHIRNPLMVKEKQWSVRAYMLIASTNPYFCFFHPGYVRSVSGVGDNIDLNDTIDLTYEQFQQLLSQEGITGDHFMTSAFETYAKRVMQMLFHSVKSNLVPRKKSYQLLELNFLIDESFGMWYIAANRVPQMSRSKLVKKEVITPMMNGLKSLVLELHDVPEAYVGMRYGDRHGGYRLVYSDYEYEIRNTTYNPCVDFPARWVLSKSDIAGTVKVHDYATRVDSAHKRELQKYTSQVWMKCKRRFKSTVESCSSSPVVLQGIADRYKIYLEKSTVNLFADSDSDSKPNEDWDEENRLDQEVKDYVAKRIIELSGGNVTEGAEGSVEA